MAADEQNITGKPVNNNEDRLIQDTSDKTTTGSNEEIMQFYNKQVLSAEESDAEIANNDGSVKETLDTAFHNVPGYNNDHSLAGSNRADFYEKRSQGKSDTDEEQEYMRNHQEE